MTDAPPAGDGFVLRRWRGADVDALVAHAGDARIAPGLSDRFPHPYTRDDAEAFLAGRVVDLSQPVYAIEIDGAPRGGIGARLGTAERRHSAEFGYWLSPGWWGQGWMTRVVAGFAPWLMQTHRLLRLQTSVLAFNEGSARVLLANGFTEEGRARCAVVKDDAVHDLRMFARTRGGFDDAA